MAILNDGYSAVLTAAAPPVQNEQPTVTPNDSWMKAKIIDWLNTHGVNIDQSQVDQFTKAELLSIVEDLLNDDMDPTDVNNDLT